MDSVLRSIKIISIITEKKYKAYVFYIYIVNCEMWISRVKCSLMLIDHPTEYSQRAKRDAPYRIPVH